MKLLFDQNISFRITKLLEHLFSGSKQVRELSLENATDTRIWNFAKQEQFTIVTFDADFYDLVTLYGHPPKVIWLRMGNTSTKTIVKSFEFHYEIIKAFITDKNYEAIACLEIA